MSATTLNYCDFCQQLPANTSNPNKYYHDNEYGFPVQKDNILFERLMLEINQAGLSWTTILNKRSALQVAYAQFDIQEVATFDEIKINELLRNPNVIRHRLKIQAAIYNAQQIIKLQKQYGSFKNWLDKHHPQEKSAWLKLFKQHFKFVGPEIVGEFLISTGYLEGAHQPNCPIFHHIQATHQQHQHTKIKVNKI